MPKLSPTMEEGQISSWVKEEGDAIEANETIAEVDTDKATMEMTSLEPGTLLKIIVPAGENAKLGQSIGIIGEEGEDFSDLLKEIESEGSSNGSSSDKTAENENSENEDSAKEETKSVEASLPITANLKSEIQNPKSNGRLFVSPIAAKMASENNINLKSIAGSGPNGRIIKRDIEKALAGGGQAGSFMQTVEVSGASAYRDENTTPMRRTIAQRLGESIGPIPTFYLTVEIEMDNALALRKAINESITPDKVSVNDIIVKIAAMSLTKHPYVNASYQNDKNSFLRRCRYWYCSSYR